MAALARRNWLENQTEIIRRLGGINYTGFTTRVQYWLTASYHYLSTCYHHFELDVIDSSLTLSTTVNTLALPADCYILIAVRLKDPATGKFLAGGVGIGDAASRLVEFTNEIGKPETYVRFKNTLYFSHIPDKAYPVDLFYYKLPANPDFTGTDVPLTGQDCDEHLIEGALRLGWPAVARPDLGEPNRQLFTEWLAETPRPSNISDPLPSSREKPVTSKTMGGPQG
jgi:hypothetical protein